MAEQGAMPITGLPYGENQEANDIAKAQPLAAAEQPVGLSLPSQRPDELETEGSPFGPGANSLDKGLSFSDEREGSEPDDVLLDTLLAAFQANPSIEVASMIKRRANGDN